MKRGLVLAVCVAVFAAGANASVLSWNDPAINYPAGGTSATFNNVNGSGVNMSFQWTGNTNRFLSNYDSGHGIVTLPDDDAAQTTMGMSGLWFGANLASATESLSLVITFSQPVYGVSFHIFDIDGILPMYEKLRIKGFLGTTPTLPSAYGSGANVGINIVPVDLDPVTEDGIIFYNIGTGDTWPPTPAEEGWLTFNGPIDKIGIQYKAIPNEARGEVFGDITFVPEPATMVLLGLGGLLLGRRK